MHQKLTALGVVLLLVTSTAVPASAALGFGDDTPSLDIAERHGNPSFIVSLDSESDATSELSEWANASSDRHVLSVDSNTNTATVAASKLDVNAGLFARVTSVQSLDDLSVVMGDDLLAAAGYVESVQPNYVHSLSRPIDELQPASNTSIPQEGITALDDPDYPLSGVAHSEDANTTYMNDSRAILGADTVTQYNGSGVRVAVVDTGANYAGGAVFQDRIANASKNFISGETVNESGYDAISDGSGHGTWTSAAVAGNKTADHRGVAPGAELLVLKALADDGSGSTSDISKSIRYAVNHESDIISLSLGSPLYDDEIVSAIEYANENGVLVVVAAGNSRQFRPAAIATPGDVKGVITVGATNGSEPPRAGSAYFSQYGPDAGTIDASGGASRGATIDVVGPGMNTVAQVPVEDGTDTKLSTLSGTSMSTPMVAGGAALLVEAHPNWGLEKIREWIRKGAVPAPNIARTEAGHGVFNAHNAIAQQEPEQDQREAMDDAAQARDAFQRSLSGDTSLLPFAVLAESQSVTAD